ncbi:MAG: phosphoribosylformylglycinamidine synthase [Thermoplasmata archaeon]|nr:MAG: phosphoribosylformylglycinamidine synthase [Thermoplasmata archaeon]RLF35806.1 MAG: phosphoribosylformylglycinamidine synthase [Thermoplasmata archaeon]
MFEVQIKIGLKKGISDPEGANTLKALHLLGFNTVKEVKTIRIIDLIIDEKNRDTVKKKVDEMCQRLLTNPVIHTYEINFKEQQDKGKMI